MKGPTTLQRDELLPSWKWKAETIVRWFRELGMTEEQKVDFLAKEFAGIQMYFEAHSKMHDGVRMP